MKIKDNVKLYTQQQMEDFWDKNSNFLIKDFEERFELRINGFLADILNNTGKALKSNKVSQIDYHKFMSILSRQIRETSYKYNVGGKDE